MDNNTRNDQLWLFAHKIAKGTITEDEYEYYCKAEWWQSVRSLEAEQWLRSWLLCIVVPIVIFVTSLIATYVLLCLLHW